MRSAAWTAIIVAVAVAGCLDSLVWGDDGHIVLVDDLFTLSADGSVEAPSDLGSPCVPARVDADAPEVTLDYWRDAEVPRAVVVRTFDDTSMTVARPYIPDEDEDAGGQHLTAFEDGTGTVAFTAPFDPDRVLATLNVADGRVTVEADDGNVTLEAGESHAIRVNYAVDVRGTALHVDEELTVTNAGPGRLVAAQPPLLCAR